MSEKVWTAESVLTVNFVPAVTVVAEMEEIFGRIASVPSLLKR